MDNEPFAGRVALLISGDTVVAMLASTTQGL